MTNRKKDRIYRESEPQDGAFRFDERVARVFPDMIRRSVPGYGLVLDLLGLAAGRFVTPGSNVYDLGCSLGAATLAMRRNIPFADTHILAIDNAAGMVSRCREQIERDNSIVPVEVRQQDILETRIENASLVVLNFTLQFIEPDRRLELLRRIRAGLRPGGVLLIAEKLRFDDAGTRALLDEWHQSFKRSRGYSDLEIARKRQALERVLQPDSLDTHVKRLREAGFDRVCQWFQALNFGALLARE